MARPKTTVGSLWKKVVLVTLAVVLLFFLVGSGLFYFWANRYVQGSEFRQMVEEKVSNALHADGTFMPFGWDGTSLHSGGFHAVGRPGSGFSQLRADDLRCHFSLSALWQRPVVLDELVIQRLQVEFETPSPGLPSEASAEAVSIPAHSINSTPAAVSLKQITILETQIQWPGGKAFSSPMHPLHWKIQPQGTAWYLDGAGGHVAQQGFPAMQTQAARLRYQDGSLYVTEAKLTLDEGGQVETSGEVVFTPSSKADLLINFKDVPARIFLSEDWRARLSGSLVGQAKLSGPLNDAQKLKVEGNVSIPGARVEALPVLDQIARFTRTEQFRHIVLQTAKTDFTWSGNRLNTTNLVLEAEGLLRIEGESTVENQTIAGQFQVGVVPSTLRWIPGAQSKVFTQQRGPYLWTTMELSGPVAHPNEDLSPRLINAAQAEVIEGVKGAAEGVIRGAADLLKPFLP